MVDIMRRNKRSESLPSYSEDEFMRIMNHKLKKEDILITDCKIVPEAFTVMNTLERTYSYRVATHPFILPLLKDRVWFVKEELNFEAMTEAAKNLIGSHDFTSFRALYRNKENKKINIREMTEVNVEKFNLQHFLGSDLPKDEIRITFRAPRFLYHQVRLMAGFLVQIGMEKFSPNAIKEYLEKPKEQDLNRFMAPPEGLYLIKVKDEYEE